MKKSLLPVLFAVCALFACKRPQEDPSPNIETKQPKIVKRVIRDSLSGRTFTTKYIYDNQNNIIQTIDIQGKDSTVTNHTYVNNLLISSVNNNRSINYTYNANGLVTQVIQKERNYPDTINYEYNGNDLVKGKFKNGEFRYGNYVNGRPGYSAGFDSLIYVYDNNYNIIQKYRPANGSYPKWISEESIYRTEDISNNNLIAQKIPITEFSFNPHNPNKNRSSGKNLYLKSTQFNSGNSSIESSGEILNVKISNGYVLQGIVKSVRYRFNNLPDGSSTPEEPEYAILNLYYE